MYDMYYRMTAGKTKRTGDMFTEWQPRQQQNILTSVVTQESWENL